MMGYCKVICVVFFAVFSFCGAEPIIHSSPHPNLKINPNQEGSCYYVVTIGTSCRSPTPNRDVVTAKFGDGAGNEVEITIDQDPSILEPCSEISFGVYGPCMYQICYMALQRTGSDGWIPSSIAVSGPSASASVSQSDAILPEGEWLEFELCNRAKATAMDH